MAKFCACGRPTCPICFPRKKGAKAPGKLLAARAVPRGDGDDERTRQGFQRIDKPVTPTEGTNNPNTDKKIAFWRQVLTTPDCWLWTGPHDAEGYGRFNYAGEALPAHRWSYEETKGAIPKGLEIDHLCREPACVRPDHLEAVTHQVNTQRAVVAGGRTAKPSVGPRDCPTCHRPYCPECGGPIPVRGATCSPKCRTKAWRKR